MPTVHSSLQSTVAYIPQLRRSEANRYDATRQIYDATPEVLQFTTTQPAAGTRKTSHPRSLVGLGHSSAHSLASPAPAGLAGSLRVQICTPILLNSILELRMERASAGGVADVAATVAATRPRDRDLEGILKEILQDLLNPLRIYLNP